MSKSAPNTSHLAIETNSTNVIDAATLSPDAVDSSGLVPASGAELATPTATAAPTDEVLETPVVPPVLDAALEGEAPGNEELLTTTTDTTATVDEATMLDVVGNGDVEVPQFANLLDMSSLVDHVDTVELRPCDFILLPGEGDQIIARHVSGSLEFTGTRQEFNEMLRG